MPDDIPGLDRGIRDGTSTDGEEGKLGPEREEARGMGTRPLRLALAVAALAAAVVGAPARGDGLACDDRTGNRFARVSNPGPYEALPSDVTVLASPVDGTPIQIGVIRPDVPAGIRVPVIVRASPYFFGGPDGDLTTCEPRLSTNFVQHGYAVAFIPVRGTADSGSCFDLLGKAERTDLDAAITWLGGRDWSNGNVGMIGLSYDGSTPWEVASMGNPHLRTIVPISGVNDLYDLMFGGGVNELRGPGLLNALYYTYGFVEYNPTDGGRAPERTVTGVLCPESLKGLAAAGYSGAAGDRDPAGFWAERNSRPGVEANYTGSVFLVQGLEDWNVDPGHSYPWVNEVEARGIYVKHLLGQWSHAFPDNTAIQRSRWDFPDMLLDWFAYWLKEDRAADLGPRAIVQDSSWMWRHEEGWPPPDATETSLYLSPDGTLSPEEPAATGIGLAALTTPDVECGATCPSFRLLVPDEDLRISGLPVVSARVTPTAPFGHLTATLFSGDKQGALAVAWRRIGWGQVNLRFPDGGETAHPLVPGVPIDVEITLEPMDAVVRAGSSLTLVLHQGTYGDHLQSVPTAPVLVEEGARSTLTLPTIVRDADDFYPTPPPV